MDQVEIAGALRKEMAALGPVVSTTAVGMAREIFPVYREAFLQEGKEALPELEAEGKEQADLFARYVEEEVVPRLLKRLTSVLEKHQKIVLKEIPELADTGRIAKAFENLEVHLSREANALVTTGVFSEQAKLLRDIDETLHAFEMRKSNETVPELGDRLFNLMGRIVEYEFFVGRIKEEGEATSTVRE